MLRLECPQHSPDIHCITRVVSIVTLTTPRLKWTCRVAVYSQHTPHCCRPCRISSMTLSLPAIEPWLAKAPLRCILLQSRARHNFWWHSLHMLTGVRNMQAWLTLSKAKYASGVQALAAVQHTTLGDASTRMQRSAGSSDSGEVWSISAGSPDERQAILRSCGGLISPHMRQAQAAFLDVLEAARACIHARARLQAQMPSQSSGSVEDCAVLSGDPDQTALAPSGAATQEDDHDSIESSVTGAPELQVKHQAETDATQPQ